MHFVDTQRRTQHITLRPLRQPVFVGPSEFSGVPDNSGVLRWRLEEESVRVSLQQNVTVEVADFIFVEGAFSGINISLTPEGPSERI